MTFINSHTGGEHSLGFIGNSDTRLTNRGRRLDKLGNRATFKSWFRPAGYLQTTLDRLEATDK